LINTIDLTRSNSEKRRNDCGQ